MNIAIGIGEYAVSKDENDKIKTYALASCVAVTAYSSLRKVGGMVHIALPSPIGFVNTHKPGYFASTGITHMINKLCEDFGCTLGELEIGIYGGADSINKEDIFRIGKKNIEAVTNLVNTLQLKIKQIDVGGVYSRTIEMDIATGITKIIYQPITI